MTYQYFRIGPRSIRVLELQPTADEASDLQGILHEASLGASDPFINSLFQQDKAYQLAFDAISYCWEGQTPDQHYRILLGGQVLLITKNADVILRKLRLSNEARTVWIDGICIDQKSIPEKNEQVPLMAEIYSRARSVQVWLGPSDESVKRIFHKFRSEEILMRMQNRASLVDTKPDQAHQLVQQQIQDYVRFTDPSPDGINLLSSFYR
jgi:hypothetical protein